MKYSKEYTQNKGSGIILKQIQLNLADAVTNKHTQIIQTKLQQLISKVLEIFRINESNNLK
jgi:hypothetical protein